MDECINLLGEKSFFSTLGPNTSYWRIEIKDADNKKTSFTSRHGLYRFIRNFFGLRDSPEPYQRTIDLILPSVK